MLIKFLNFDTEPVYENSSINGRKRRETQQFLTPTVSSKIVQNTSSEFQKCRVQRWLITLRLVAKHGKNTTI